MARQTRREFLENSMFAATAAALAGGSLVPQASAEPQSTSPSERLRVAVVGLNGRGQSHLGGFMGRQDCEVVAVCDPDEAVLQTRGVDVVEKKTKKKPAAYIDIRKMLDDNKLVCCGTHTPYESVQPDKLKETIEFNRTIGNKYLIVPWMEGKTAEEWMAKAKFFNDLADKVRSEGMLVGYHAHAHDFPAPQGLIDETEQVRVNQRLAAGDEAGKCGEAAVRTT